jgi:hypothetical protein
MITGNSATLQIGRESVWGTIIVPTNKINFSSADFKEVRSKKDNGLLTGKIIASGKETMSIKTSGTLSTLAKPEGVGLFLAGALGRESVAADAESGKYLHSFLPVGNAESDFLPSFTVVVDKKGGIYAYPGLVIDTLALSAAAEDYLKLDVTFAGKSEETGTLATGLSPEVTKAFKFRGGKAYLSDSEIADCTSLKFELKNNLTSDQTTSTGEYFSQPQQATREITSDIEIVYSTETEALRGNWWKTDNTFSFKLNFEDDDGNTLTLTIPTGQVTTCDPPAMSGKDTLKQSISIQAVASDNDAVLVELLNGRETTY